MFTESVVLCICWTQQREMCPLTCLPNCPLVITARVHYMCVFQWWIFPRKTARVCVGGNNQPRADRRSNCAPRIVEYNMYVCILLLEYCTADSLLLLCTYLLAPSERRISLSPSILYYSVMHNGDKKDVEMDEWWAPTAVKSRARVQ